jgi:DNA-binding response OmpR family regulator
MDTMHNARMRILVVEDNAGIAAGLQANLEQRRYAVDVCTTVAEAWHALEMERFDAVLLDLGLPDRDGMELLRVVRAIEPHLPVLILSARDGVEHRLSGLHGGADDYLVKPFDLRELAARLHALVRRTQGRAAQVIDAGPLRLEPGSGQAWLHGEPVALSRREVDLLAHLAGGAGRWMPSDLLKQRLFGLGGEVGSNTLSVHIHNIRRKLGAQAIESMRGLGYRLALGGPGAA